MNETQPTKQESASTGILPSAVDDVRRVREKIAAQYDGDFRKHCEDTNRIFEELQKKLHLKVVSPPDGRARRSRT